MPRASPRFSEGKAPSAPLSSAWPERLTVDEYGQIPGDPPAGTINGRDQDVPGSNLGGGTQNAKSGIRWVRGSTAYRLVGHEGSRRAPEIIQILVPATHVSDSRGLCSAELRPPPCRRLYSNNYLLKHESRVTHTLTEYAGVKVDISACHGGNHQQVCPILDTHDKFEEAHHFFHSMLEFYHQPYVWRFNLNAFLQSIASVMSFLHNADRHKIPDFAEWYVQKQKELDANSILRAIGKGRNLVVHQRMLKTRSVADLGLFAGRQLRLGMEVEFDPFRPSAELLKFLQDHGMPGLDPERSAIGEQAGVHRRWVVEELGEEEVERLAYDALTRVGRVLQEAHSRLGLWMLMPYDCYDEPTAHTVLLETDLDPSLPKKWGWLD